MRFEDWLEQDPRRWEVDHLSFGHGWGTECPLDVFSVGWSPQTGELYSVERGTQQVELIGVIRDVELVRSVTEGWEEQQRTEGGLYWLRARVAALPAAAVSAGPDQQRQLGARYRVEQEDGTWWELGWDRPLSTFYAQRYGPSDDPLERESLLDWKGQAFGELRDVADVEQAIGQSLPEDMSAELATDKAWFPNERRPPFLDFAESFVSSVRSAPSEEAEPQDPQSSGDAGGRVTQDNDVDRRHAELDRRERDLELRERQLNSQHAAMQTIASVEPRWSLPVGPVADLLRATRRVTGDDLTKVAQGFGLDPSWAMSVLSGEVEEVGLPHVQQVCEGVHCSPYDLWGKDDAQTILHAYGPELWPRLIEPLQDELGFSAGPTPGVDL